MEPDSITTRNDLAAHANSIVEPERMKTYFTESQVKRARVLNIIFKVYSEKASRGIDLPSTFHLKNVLSLSALAELEFGKFSDKVKEISVATIEAISHWNTVNKNSMCYKTIGKVEDQYTGNNSAWKFLCPLLESTIKEGRISSKVKADVTLALNMARMRMSTCQNPESANRGTDDSDCYLRMISLINTLERLVSLRSEDHKKIELSINKLNSKRPFYSEDELKSLIPTFKLSDDPDLDLSSLNLFFFGKLVYVRFSNTTAVFLREHLTRIINVLKSLSTVGFCWHYVARKNTFKAFVTDFIDLSKEFNNIDEFPPVLKAAKQFLVASLGSDAPLGIPPEVLYESSLESWRQLKLRRTTSVLVRYSRSTLDAINLGNLFKSCFHPEVSYPELFETIEGLCEPNQVKRDLLIEFKGRINKVLFESLSLQGLTPRLEIDRDLGMAFPGCDLADELVAKSRELATRRVEILGVSDFVWSKVQVTLEEKILKAADIKIRAQSKSSGPKTVIFREEILNTEDNDVPSVVEQYKNENDIVAYLRNPRSIDTLRSIQKFETLIRRNEEVEESQGIEVKAQDIADPNCMIPEDLSALAFRELVGRSSCYGVSTEPKFGEKHKKNTRVFYLADRDFKTITQITERIAKQATRRQSGDAIVQDARSRRRILEMFAQSMTDSQNNHATNEAREPLFISFDLSEFSKRFPLPLLRIYGRALAFITGDEWMRRIDLIFRASRVLLAKKGFLGVSDANFGGFEGYFNFIWTSIHEVIMRLTLEKLGIKGVISTYSDDGLLMLLVPKAMTTTERKDLLEAIQKSYSEFGLTFKYTKTLVSGKVWEYLGDVCFEGKLLSQAVKEIASIGDLSANRCITSTYDHLVSLSSQVSAASRHGLCPVLTTQLNHVTYINELRRRFPRADLPTIFHLVIFPPQYGGFRLRSYAEESLITSLEIDSEIVSDLILLMPIFAREIYCSMNFISRRVRLSSRPYKILTGGSTFELGIGNLSGSAMYTKAIRAIKEKSSLSNLSENPLKGGLGEVLSILARGFHPIKPGCLNVIIQSLPEMIDYQESIAVVKSSAALMILTSIEVKRLQSEDTRIIRSHLRELSEHRDYTPGRSIIERFEEFRRRSYPDITMLPVRASWRSILRPSPTPGAEMHVAECEVRLVSLGCYGSIGRCESSERFLPTNSSLKWRGERSGSQSDKSRSALLDSLAQLLVSNPGLSQMIVALLEISGLKGLPAGAICGLNTYRNPYGNDCVWLAPSRFKDLFKVTPFGPILSYFCGGEKIPADRSTFDIYLKSLSYARLLVETQLINGTVEEVHSYRWFSDSRNIDALMLAPPMVAKKGFYWAKIIGYESLIPQLSSEEKTDFSKTFMALKGSADWVDQISDRFMRSLTPSDVMATLKIISCMVSRALVSIYNGHDELTQLPKILPGNMSLLRDSIVQAALNLIHPMTRGHLFCQLLAENPWKERIDEVLNCGAGGGLLHEVRKRLRKHLQEVGDDGDCETRSPTRAEEFEDSSPDSSESADFIAEETGDGLKGFLSIDDVVSTVSQASSVAKGEFMKILCMLRSILVELYPASLEDLTNFTEEQALNIAYNQLKGFSFLTESKIYHLMRPVSEFMRHPRPFLQILRLSLSATINHIKFSTGVSPTAIMKQFIHILTGMRCCLHSSTHRAEPYNVPVLIRWVSTVGYLASHTFQLARDQVSSGAIKSTADLSEFFQASRDSLVAQMKASEGYTPIPSAEKQKAQAEIDAVDYTFGTFLPKEAAQAIRYLKQIQDNVEMLCPFYTWSGKSMSYSLRYAREIIEDARVNLIELIYEKLILKETSSEVIDSLRLTTTSNAALIREELPVLNSKGVLCGKVVDLRKIPSEKKVLENEVLPRILPEIIFRTPSLIDSHRIDARFCIPTGTQEEQKRGSDYSSVEFDVIECATATSVTANIVSLLDTLKTPFELRKCGSDTSPMWRLYVPRITGSSRLTIEDESESRDESLEESAERTLARIVTPMQLSTGVRTGIFVDFARLGMTLSSSRGISVSGNRNLPLQVAVTLSRWQKNSTSMIWSYAFLLSAMDSGSASRSIESLKKSVKGLADHILKCLDGRSKKVNARALETDIVLTNIYLAGINVSPSGLLSASLIDELTTSVKTVAYQFGSISVPVNSIAVDINEATIELGKIFHGVYENLMGNLSSFLWRKRGSKPIRESSDSEDLDDFNPDA